MFKLGENYIGILLRMETLATPPKEAIVAWKLWAAIAVVAFGMYKLVTAPAVGDSLFSLIVAFLLFFSEAKFVPSRFAIDLRHIFKYGDKYARLLIFIIAIGGTALAIKLYVGLSLIPDYIDFWFKRSSIPLLSIAILIYISSILSKITFYLSDIKNDISLNRFEFLFYVFVLVFCLFVTLSFLGISYMDTAVTSQTQRAPGDFVWSPYTARFLLCVTTVSLIWALGYGLCVFSRFCEWFLRERYAAKIVSEVEMPNSQAEVDS